jgi:mannosyltransferase
VAALTLLVGALASVRLGSRPTTFDESVTIEYIDQSWPGLWDTVTEWDPNMSLYYGAAKLWSQLVGIDTVALRSLSVVAAVLCVPVVYAIGLRLFGVGAGLFAALLLSINVFFLHYAQDARAYALVTLLVSLSTYFFVRGLEHPTRSVEAGYVASSALALYAHFFAVWVVLIQVLTLAVIARRRSIRMRPWLVCYGALSLLVAPMLYWVLTFGGDPIGWLERPDIGAVPATYAQLAGDSFFQLAAVIVFFAVALRSAAGNERLVFGLAFTAGWAFLPVVAAFVVAQVKPSFLAKYLIVCLPAMMLLAAGSVTSLRSTKLAFAAGILLVGLGLPALWSALVHGFGYYS